MRIVDHSFTTSNPNELFPLIQNRCSDLPNNARKISFFLYQGVDTREFFKVEFLLNDLGLVYRWFYHGYYFDESGGSQQTFNEFNFEPVLLGELISHISGDIQLGMQEWLTLKS